MARVLNKNGLIAVLDIGTSKTCCLLARPVSDDRIDLISTGYYQSRGIDKAEIAGFEDAVSSVRHAVADAEKDTGERIETVIISANAKQLESALINDAIELNGMEVAQNDINRLIEKVQDQIPENTNEILHCIPIDYSLDNRHALSDPRGLTGNRLSLILHTVSTPPYPIRDMNAVLERSHLECAKVVASPYAAGLACLKKDELEQGSVVIDLGAGTTGIGYFYGGQFVWCDRIPLGGENITDDLVKTFKTAPIDAERIKTLNGSTLPSSSYDLEEIEIPLIGEDAKLVSITVSKSDVVRVIEPRVEEIFSTIRTLLEQKKFYDYCLNVVLVGGGAQLHGICEKATTVMGRNARLGQPIHISPRQTTIPEHTFPAFIGCFGLLRYATKYLLNTPFAREQARKPRNIFVKIYRWFLDNC